MIDSDRLYEAGVMPASCAGCGWNDDGTLVIVDRYSTDFPPIPRFDPDAFVEVYRCAGGDPDDRIGFCPVCDTDLNRLTMNERKVTA